MKEICEWCQAPNAEMISGSVYWELPDGTRAIEITDAPTITCPDCQMVYQKESIVKEIEDQLFLIDCKKVGKTITFEELMTIPRLLKRNYFDFS
ncbi:YokU family protein [Bacillus sp. JJ1764]|uniref:YokU family protein n=1 Tax=Bacillus sp. JJ1764 TaxID=3122964 RepID=UPI002FFFEAFB